MLCDWQYLNEIIVPELRDERIGILIGCDCPQAMEPWEVIHSQDGGPYALKTILGWTVVGPRSPRKPLRSSKKVNRTKVSIIDEIEKLLVSMHNSDFVEKSDGEPTLSREDRLWEEKVNTSIKIVSGRHQIGLPFRDSIVRLPNNRKLAERRAKGLKRFIKKNPDMHDVIPTT